MFVVSGNGVLLFDSKSGTLIDSKVGLHKANIYTVAITVDDSILATGGADNTILIWDGADFNPKKKFTMDGSIQTACFNPVTNRLFIGTTKDTGIYIPDATANALDRKGIKSKVTCGDWTSDGRLLAFGTSTGLMAVKDAQFEKKVNVQKLSGISCVKWSPTTAELPDLILVVACIDQSISIHREDGEIIGFEKRVKYEVHALDWYCTGEYFIAGGSSPIVTIFAREGTILQEIETGFDWIWSCKFQNTLNAFAIGGNKGQIKVMAFDKLMPIAVSEDKFSTRLGMTEIVIKDLNSDKKAKFRCKELVKNISINGKALAVHTLSRILFYEEYNLYGEGDQQMHVESFSYKPIGKLDKKLEGNFFTLLAENFILSKDNRISSYDMSKNLSREWVFDSNVCFLKRLGGPAKEECLLVGLKNGNAFKIFVSNPFPILIIEHGVEITSLDMNLSKKLMAVVDAKNNFYLYDVAKKESITSELKISQCMFSQDFENMYVVMGEGVVYVKSTEFEGVTAPASGNIISFKGNKVRVVNGETVTTIEVPFTPFLMHYMSKKDFKNGYKIACIGVSDNDMRYIGMEALKNKEFAIARKCFTRTRDLEYLDIINRCEAESKSGKFDELGLQVELLCYDKKIPKAIEVLKKDGNLEKAIELCITMRKWSDAMELIKSAQSSGKLKSDKFNLFKLLKMQADSEAMKGNWRAAVDLLISANQESRAVEILIKNDQEEQVIQLMRKLNKTAHGDTLRECVKYFVGKKNHNAGKEALLKLGDQEELMKFHIELEHWDEAQMLAASDDSLKQIMLIPYADWLSKKNRFDEASEYYKQAGRVDLAMQILQTLSELSVVQEKFREAGQFHWILAKEMLKGVNSFRNPSVDDKEKIAKFNSCLSKSFIYQAYHPVLAYTRSPIKEEDYPGQHKIIFNSSRFIMANMKSANNAKISFAKVNYVLAKLANNYGGYKLARVAFDKLQSHVLSAEWVEEVEAQALLAKSKPMKDSESAGLVCPRCRTEVQIMTDGATCGNCYYPLVFSPLGFENLPLVEFTVPSDITVEKVIELLGTDLGGAKSRTGAKKKNGKMWDFNIENQGKDEEALNVDRERQELEDNSEYNTRFGDKISETCDIQIGTNSYIVVEIDHSIIKTLDPDDVFIVDHRKLCQDYPVRYFKNMQKDTDIMMCPSCQQFFDTEEFDLLFNKTKACPFCSSKNIG